MLESVLANVMQQFLQPGNLHNAHAAKSIQRIVGEVALTDIAANHSRGIVGREARKAHGTSLHPAHDRTECVVLAHRPGNDLLKIHAEVLEEMLGQVAAMKA